MKQDLLEDYLATDLFDAPWNDVPRHVSVTKSSFSVLIGWEIPQPYPPEECPGLPVQSEALGHIAGVWRN